MRVENGYFTDETLTQNLGKTKNSGTGAQTHFVSNGATLFIPKYNAQRLIINNNQIIASLNDVKYFFSGFDQITLSGLGVTGKLSDLGGFNLARFDFYGCAITGDLSDIIKPENTRLNRFHIQDNPNVTGDISVIGTVAAPLSGFTRITLNNCSQITGDISIVSSLTGLIVLDARGTNVYGTIESVATGQIAAGKTTGGVSIVCNGKITYQGNPIPNGKSANITIENGSYSVTIV